MTQKISPFLEGKYGWDFGESGWNSGMDENLLKFSFLFDRNVDSIVSTLPTASDGEAHYNTTDNRIYFAVGTTYYSTPVPKWFVITIRDTGAMWQFNGTSLVQLEGTQNLDTRLDSVELTVSTLGTAAFQDSAYFATQAALEVASAQANSYTDAVVDNKGIMSVRDYITSTIDGTTSNQAGIEAAVSAAYAAGADLHWPAGTYISDTDIPNFHEVRHIGPGAVKRGASVFYVDPAQDQLNIVYVSPLGAGDGIAASTPTTLDGAHEILKARGPALRGRWVVELAPGTYSPPSSSWDNIRTQEYLVIRGPDVSNGTPTAIIDAKGGTYCLYFTGDMRVRVINIKAINATGSPIASGIVANIGGWLWADNVHTDNTQWAGINANNIQRLYVYGGRFANSMYGVRTYAGTHFSVGREDRRPQFVSCSTGFIAQGMSYGHTDYCDFISCATGIEVEYESHSTSYFNFFTGCNRLHHVGINSSISRKNNTGSAGSMYDVARFGGTFAEDDRPYRYSQQFFPDFGAGWFKWGYQNYTAPVAPFQFSKDGTLAGGDLSGMGAATSMLESNGNTILGLASPAAYYSGIWFGTGGSANRAEIRGSASGALEFRLAGLSKFAVRQTDVTPLVDNSISSGSVNFRWSTIYAGTGTINTSDERAKQQIKPIDEAALRAWASVEYVQYKFNDAVEQKGDGARWHFGLIAQRVKEAFEAEGLNAFDYGLLCYDEWGETPAVEERRDDEGNVVVEAENYRPAGSRYGIRYEEALALECAYLRSLVGK